MKVIDFIYFDWYSESAYLQTISFDLRRIQHILVDLFGFNRSLKDRPELRFYETNT